MWVTPIQPSRTDWCSYFYSYWPYWVILHKLSSLADWLLNHWKKLKCVFLAKILDENGAAIYMVHLVVIGKFTCVRRLHRNLFEKLIVKNKSDNNMKNSAEPVIMGKLSQQLPRTLLLCQGIWRQTQSCELCHVWVQPWCCNGAPVFF